MKSVTERELIEINHEWVCSLCGCPFSNPDCVLDGLTLHELFRHLKTMMEQTFARHACPSPSLANNDARHSLLKYRNVCISLVGVTSKMQSEAN